MQPIERYALVTLLFLVALVLVVAFWDDDGSGAATPEDGPRVARVEESRPTPAQARRTGERKRPASAPLTGRDDVAPPTDRVSTLARHSSPGPSQANRAALSAATGAAVAAPPRTPAPEELDGMLQPSRERSFDFQPLGSKVSAERTPSGSSPQSQGRRVEANETTRRLGDLRPLDRPRGGSRAASTGDASGLPSASSAGPAARDQVAPTSRPSETSASSALASASREYTIRPGDSLERIARRELGDASAVRQIAALNGLTDTDTIIAGETLVLPAQSTVAAGSGPVASAVGASEGQTIYTIRGGDVLSRVLEEKYGTYKRSIGVVLALNPGLDPDVVIEGTKIVLPRLDQIPGGVTTAQAAPREGRTQTASASTGRASSTADNEYVVR